MRVYLITIMTMGFILSLYSNEATGQHCFVDVSTDYGHPSQWKSTPGCDCVSLSLAGRNIDGLLSGNGHQQCDKSGDQKSTSSSATPNHTTEHSPGTTITSTTEDKPESTTKSATEGTTTKSTTKEKPESTAKSTTKDITTSHPILETSAELSTSASTVEMSSASPTTTATPPPPPTTSPDTTTPTTIPPTSTQRTTTSLPTTETPQNCVSEKGAIFTSCTDVLDSGFTTSGVYLMLLNNVETEMYCEIQDGEAWMVIQRRMDGSTDFYQNWDTYLAGFGNMCGEFYWGNINLKNLLDGKPWILRVEIVTYDPDRTDPADPGSPEGLGANEYFSYIEYDEFAIDKGNYHMQVTNPGVGTAPDGLIKLQDVKFSTYDNDNDGHSDYNCAEYYHTGWWYNGWPSVGFNLNGKYYHKGDPRDPWQGIVWETDKLVVTCQMKIKPPPPL